MMTKNKLKLSVKLFLLVLLLSACKGEGAEISAYFNSLGELRPVISDAVMELASGKQSGASDLAPYEQAATEPFESKAVEDVFNPLTGLPPSDRTLLDRRPVAVKITLYPRSNRPQWGLSLADHVYEYYHNNDLTRFHAIFYGQDAELAGPIRSGRLPDEYLMNTYGSAMVYASADSRIRSVYDSAFPNSRLIAIMEGTCPPTPVCRYDPIGFNHLVANTAEVSEYIEDGGGENEAPNLAGMQFSDQAPDSNDEVERIYLRYSYSAYAYWDYAPEQENYIRYQDDQDDIGGRGEEYVKLTDRLTGEAVRAENIVVLFINHFHFVYEAPSNGVPAIEIVDMDFEGRGEAYAFRNGMAYALEWERDSQGLVRLTFENGRPYEFKPGNTWFQIITEESKLDAQSDTWTFNFVLQRP